MGETSKTDMVLFPLRTAEEITKWGLATALWAGQQVIYGGKKLFKREKSERRDLLSRPPDQATKLAQEVSYAGSSQVRERKASQLLWLMRKRQPDCRASNDASEGCVAMAGRVLMSHLPPEEVKPLLTSEPVLKVIEQSL